MNQPRLFHYLARLDKKELLQFEPFLASPYFNHKEHNRQLFAYLRSYHPDYEKVNLARLASTLWPERQNDRPFLNSRFSELSRLVEQFFFQQECQADEALQEQARRQAFRRRGLFRAFNRECTRQLKSLQEAPLIDALRADRLRVLHQQWYEQPQSPARAAGQETAEQLLHQLDLHYLLLKLRYMSDLLARGLTFDETPQVRLWPAALEAAQDLRVENPLVDLYCRLILLFREKCPADEFEAVEQCFSDLRPHLEKTEQRFLLIKLCSLANYKLNTGENTFTEKLFRLYQLGVTQDLFSEGGQFPDQTFLNICTSGARLGHYEWVEEFIRQHRDQLPADVKEEAAALGSAYLRFHKGDFEKAFHLLQDVRTSRLTYKIRIRSLLVRCLLELHLESPGYYRAMLARLDAYDRFLKRCRGLSPERRQGYLNFGRIVRRITELRSFHWNDRQARAEAVAHIRQQQPLMLRSWLVEKVKGMG